jgi:hypothetical protein
MLAARIKPESWHLMFKEVFVAGTHRLTGFVTVCNYSVLLAGSAIAFYRATFLGGPCGVLLLLGGLMVLLAIDELFMLHEMTGEWELAVALAYALAALAIVVAGLRRFGLLTLVPLVFAFASLGVSVAADVLQQMVVPGNGFRPEHGTFSLSGLIFLVEEAGKFAGFCALALFVVLLEPVDDT